MPLCLRLDQGGFLVADMDGWIKLHRQLLENPIASKPEYAWVWISILLLANHKDKEILLSGKVEICKRGQFITSRQRLSEQTGVSCSTVERCLSWLKNNGEIEQQGTNKYRLITVKNYNRFQSDEQQMDSQRYTTKNIRKKKYIKKKETQIDLGLVAKQVGVSQEVAQTEWAKASDWAKSKGKLYKDYNAFLRNWIRGRDKFGSKPKPRQDLFSSLVDSL